MLLRPEIFLLPEDLETLRPHCLVNGIAINGYLRLIERRSCYYRHLPSVWACDSSFRADWLRGGYSATKWRVRSIDPFRRELLLFPIHHPDIGPHGHWTLVAVWPRRAEIAAYDSLGCHTEAAMQDVLDFLRAHAAEKNLPFEEDGWALTKTPRSCPRQADRESCGVFVCVFADRLARHRDLSKAVDVEVARETIGKILKRGRFDNEDFSHYQNVASGFTDPSSPVAVVDLLSPEPLDEAPGASKPEVDKEETGYPPSTDPPSVHGLSKPEGPCEEARAMELGESPGVRSSEEPIGGMASSPCLSLRDGDLEEELAGDSAPPREIQVEPPLQSDRRLHRGRQRERTRERPSQDVRRAERNRPRLRHRDDRHRRRPTQRRGEGGPPRDNQRRERRDARRELPHQRQPEDLRRKLELARRDRRRGGHRAGSPERDVRISIQVRRRFDESPRAGPSASSSSARRRSFKYPGRQPFEIPRHLKERIAELEAQGWSKKDLKNKRWEVTRADGSTFRIRGAKLRKLTHLF